MYSVSTKEDPTDSSALEIVFSGELLIENIDSIVTETRKLIGEYDSYLISAHEIDDMDLSFVQFIFSLEKSLLAQNKKVEKKMQMPETFAELFTNTGLGTIMA